jgi:hypothetical protein
MCKYLSELRQRQLTYDVGEITNSILLVERESKLCGSLLTNRVTARTNRLL